MVLRERIAFIGGMIVGLGAVILSFLVIGDLLFDWHIFPQPYL